MSTLNQPIGQVNTPFWPARILVGRYQSGGAISIELVSEEDPQDALVFSTNLVPSGARLAPDEFNVKSWSENEPFVTPLLGTGLFEDTGRRVRCGFIESPIWRVKAPAHVPSAATARANAPATNIAALIADAETEAARGCGQSDVLYEARVQAAYASILDRAPEAERAETEAALRKRGFDPDFVPYEAGEGECSLTGIYVNCCPCGRHL